jgi:hypothetical protein
MIDGLRINWTFTSQLAVSLKLRLLAAGFARMLCQRRDIEVTNYCVINTLTPNDPHRGPTAPLTSKVAFYIFIQQIWVMNILNTVYTIRSFSLQNAVVS